ncbi:MAG: tRNA uridine-5-carboxymethylaminomethyl(34) synthesis GTPase MnmE [Gammaproteobacteria bacterium]
MRAQTPVTITARAAECRERPRAVVRETIVAVASPAGRGAIGIVRVSGGAALDIARALTGTTHFEPRHAHYRRFLDSDGEAFDDGIVVFFPAPHSYTGEDLVEFQGHGNPLLLQRLCARACACGARLARAGEFTERAFLNERLDLAQAEAVADLIASPSLRAARAARRTLAGEFGQAVSAIVERIRLVRAELEAGIDFGEEVDTDTLLVDHHDRHLAVCQALVALLERARHGVRLHSGLDVAIVGAPNVGKSSLLNRLAGVDRAIVTPVPGTTRDLVDIDLVIGSVPVHLVDTAGLRESTDVVEVEGMRRTCGAAASADLIVYVTDGSAAPALGAALPNGVPRIVVRNKIDLLPDRHATGPGEDYASDVRLSALTGEGCADLVAAIERFAGIHGEDSGEFAARTRHLVALERALEALQGGDGELAATAPELAAEHYRRATDALEAIAGRYESEDLLGDIFARFCIGK